MAVELAAEVTGPLDNRIVGHAEDAAFGDAEHRVIEPEFAPAVASLAKVRSEIGREGRIAVCDALPGDTKLADRRGRRNVLVRLVDRLPSVERPSRIRVVDDRRPDGVPVGGDVRFSFGYGSATST